MPTIYDNIEKFLAPELIETLKESYKADFCVGFFNLFGWELLSSYIENFSGTNNEKCRLLIGIQSSPKEDLKKYRNILDNNEIDQKELPELKKKIVQDFKTQLELQIPSNKLEEALNKLIQQIENNKLDIKLYLEHPLHAKLYLLFTNNRKTPIVGYLGSSNLTFSGLQKQGELNVDILDQDAATKLATWFEERWNSRFCLNINKELIEIIKNSWVQKDIKPFHIYLKMAYHLSQEARLGLAEFAIPKDFRNILFDYQKVAVQIASRYLNKRNGVIIGDVVGLGKTLMATAITRIFEDDHGFQTLIICPVGLVHMWEHYRGFYGMRAKIIPYSKVIKELKDLKRYKLVLIDESHNLRNRETKVYQAIREYIQSNDSKVLLLTATPYNKSFEDLANQLRLFINEDDDLGIKPEKYIKEHCDNSETEFYKKHPNCHIRSIGAFEKSCFADDWRELLRLFLVRRTRQVVENIYAKTDKVSGRKYLELFDGSKNYFPLRIPKTIKFQQENNQYGKLFSEEVENNINTLLLPRYGLLRYLNNSNKSRIPNAQEKEIIKNLTKAGERLIGFTRINLFKRLESSGDSFIKSLQRQIIKNYIFIYAIQNNLKLPIGKSIYEDLSEYMDDTDNDTDNDEIEFTKNEKLLLIAQKIYEKYLNNYETKFKWIGSDLFDKKLLETLNEDCDLLNNILKIADNWNPSEDPKINELEKLISKHKNEKILVFTQFADTAKYIEKELINRGITCIKAITGQMTNQTEFVYKFSPESNNKTIEKENQIQIVISTDVLSEGQNLQDAHIIVNFDIPWAIIRLIQRAGRVDRIGQKSPEILCYTFLPAEGLEKIIQLRERVKNRLNQNSNVIGSDEKFFGDEEYSEEHLTNIYNEAKESLNDNNDQDIDLHSHAYHIWKTAIAIDPKLEKIIPEMPNNIYSTKQRIPTEHDKEGVLVYVKTDNGSDALAFLDKEGNSITESQFEILSLARCSINEKLLPKEDIHHELVETALKQVHGKIRNTVSGGQMSKLTTRVYNRLNAELTRREKTPLLFPQNEISDLKKAINDLYNGGILMQEANDILHRQLKMEVSDKDLVNLVIALYSENKLTLKHKTNEENEARIICSMGIFDKN